MNISITKKDIPKRKTPFFFTLKSLSNKRNYILLHRHWLWRHRSSLKSLSLRTESFAEVQSEFVTNNCHFVSQSSNLNKDYDCLNLAYFIREQSTADATFTPLENKVWFQNSSCLPLNFFRVLKLPACLRTEQSALEASLFVKHPTRAREVIVECTKHKIRTSHKIP